MIPMPPESLRHRVSGETDAGRFDRIGRQSVTDLTQALAGIGRGFGDFRTVLDWGCGCGRVLRHLPPGADQILHGCDIDGEAIAWLQEHMPAISAVRSDGLPPLPYADGQFDLIINHSVLSHLDEHYQDAWLAELGRVLAPEGVLVLTVHGAYSQEVWVDSLRDAPDRDARVAEMYRAVDRDGLYFIVDRSWSQYYPDYYQNTLHAPWYVFEHWTRFFDILLYKPRASIGLQDMIVLRHKRFTVPGRSHPSEVERRIAGS